MYYGAAFQEISHCGGYLQIDVVVDENNSRSYSIEIGGSSSTGEMALWAVYALPPGVAVETIRLGGIGQPWNAPPIDGTVPVFIGSDRTGCFGHACPRCDRYWRSKHGSSDQTLFCPYCGWHAKAHRFLTAAHHEYLRGYVRVFIDAVNAPEPGRHRVDFDRIADASQNIEERPPFVYAEESQQYRYDCTECGAFNDVLGNAVYCCTCGSRNDLALFRQRIDLLRKELHDGRRAPADCLRDAVSYFDGALRHLVDQIVSRIPMRPRARSKLTERANHQLSWIRQSLQDACGIDIFEATSPEDCSFCERMSLRRHVHEHLNGIVDRGYLDKSGDEGVRLGQALVETTANVQRLTQLLVTCMANAQDGFHDIFPPKAKEIEYHRKFKQGSRKAAPL